MRILSLTQCPDAAPDIEFKTSGASSLVATIVCAGLSLGLLALALHRGDRLPRWWCYAGSVMLGMVAILSFVSHRKSRCVTNWLLRSTGTRLWIKFRSFLNNHLSAEEPQVVELDQSDVGWVRRVDVHATYLARGNGDGPDWVSTSQVMNCLDMGLKSSNTAELEAALKKERLHQGNGRNGIGVRYAHAQVRVNAPGVIRLTFADQQGRIKPGVEEALKFFARWTPVREAVVEKGDYRPEALSYLPEAELHRCMLELTRIDLFSAHHVAKSLKGLSMSEAMTWLDSI